MQKVAGRRERPGRPVILGRPATLPSAPGGTTLVPDFQALRLGVGRGAGTGSPLARPLLYATDVTVTPSLSRAPSPSVPPYSLPRDRRFDSTGPGATSLRPPGL